MTVEFPVGYFALNDNEAFNFQLNRFYSQGAFTQEELMDIGRKIDGFETWIELFTQLGEKVQDIDPFKAATCFRAAQFYTLAGQKDAQGNDLKHFLYDPSLPVSRSQKQAYKRLWTYFSACFNIR